MRRKILSAIFVVLVNVDFLFSQQVALFEYQSNFPIVDAMIIQNGKLLGNTNEQGLCQNICVYSNQKDEPISDVMIIQNNNLIGYTNEKGCCVLKNVDIKSKACIKAFGFNDTCLYINEDAIIYLKPITFGLREVQVEETTLSPYQQLIKFLYYSLSLCNQENEIRSYEYSVTIIPDNINAYDKVEGRFIYKERNPNRRRNYQDLYQCSAQRQVTKNLYTDSIVQDRLEGSAKLPIVIWYLDNLNKLGIKNYERWLKDKPIYKEYSDSTGYLFVYSDTNNETSQITWHFDVEGRLYEVETIELHERSKFDAGRRRGNWYTRLQYTQSGLLKIEKGVRVTMSTSHYSNQTKIMLSDRIDCETTMKIPLSISPAGWAKINNIPTVVVDN